MLTIKDYFKTKKNTTMQNALTDTMDAPATPPGTPERHPASTGTDARRKAQQAGHEVHLRQAAP